MKDLSKTVFVVTQDAPKKFRFSLVSRLQFLSMEVVGHLYRVNEIIIDPGVANSKKHAGPDHQAELTLKSVLPEGKNRERVQGYRHYARANLRQKIS